MQKHKPANIMLGQHNALSMHVFIMLKNEAVIDLCLVYLLRDIISITEISYNVFNIFHTINPVSKG